MAGGRPKDGTGRNMPRPSRKRATAHNWFGYLESRRQGGTDFSLGPSLNSKGKRVCGNVLDIFQFLKPPPQKSRKAAPAAAQPAVVALASPKRGPDLL